MDPLNSFSSKMNVKKRIDSKLTGVWFNHDMYFSSSFPLNPSEFDREYIRGRREHEGERRRATNHLIPSVI
jgi:hypothetical protein